MTTKEAGKGERTALSPRTFVEIGLGEGRQRLPLPMKCS